MINDIVKLAMFVIIAGVILLGITIILPVVLPIIGVLLVLYILYLFLKGRIRIQ